ncbi:acyltransferase [Escherichia coli]|uniref:acyltransferase n=1 Tax=Escherichia coli TaxID=562 RepID=UPI00234C2188|nr:acyltransferase [Escherichia coli]MDC6784400.1 acyltransferase [Escherichia coli]MDC6833845.1 acyltransferase [Escherichia coli]MDC7010234.1 acyltransferase [Escherichia coli]MDC7065054.1 acyltransferase [Escherichia coli]
MRNVSADFLRIICCLLVIAIHVTPDYATMVKTGQSDLIVYQSMFTQAIVRAGLPIFFIMSGYFLLNRKTENLWSGYRKRLATLLVPFFIYAFINYYFQHNDAFYNKGIGGFFELLYKSPTGISVHLWFVYSLLGIYIVYPAIKVITDAIPLDKTAHSLIFIAVICCWPQYEHQLGKVITGYHNIIPIPQIYLWLGYFIAGGLLQRVKIKRSTTWKLFAASLAMQVTFTWLSVNSLGFDTKPYDFSVSMFFFSSMLILIVTGTHFDNDKPASKIILFIAPFTYGVYLIHIAVREKVSYYLGIPAVVDYLAIKTMLYVIIIFAISLFAAIVIDKMVVNHVVRLFKGEFKVGKFKNV